MKARPTNRRRDGITYYTALLILFRNCHITQTTQTTKAAVLGGPLVYIPVVQHIST